MVQPKTIDVTGQTDVLWSELERIETMEITRCLCGAENEDGLFRIRKHAWSTRGESCPQCGRKFIFELSVRVLQVVEDA